MNLTQLKAFSLILYSSNPMRKIFLNLSGFNLNDSQNFAQISQYRQVLSPMESLKFSLKARNALKELKIRFTNNLTRTLTGNFRMTT